MKRKNSMQEIDAKIEAYKDALKQLNLVHRFKKMTIEAIVDIEHKIQKLERERNA